MIDPSLVTSSTLIHGEAGGKGVDARERELKGQPIPRVSLASQLAGYGMSTVSWTPDLGPLAKV